MGASFIRFLLTALLLAVFCGTVVAAEYRVILRDGSWLRAQSKPVVKDGQAHIRLLAGQLALVPQSHVDWKASESWNRPRPGVAVVPERTLPAPANPVPATIHMVGEPADPAAEPTEPAEAATEAQPPAAEPNQASPQQDSQLRERIRRFDQQLTGLRDQKADLEAQARSAIHLEDAAKLRAQAQEVQRKIEAARAAQSRLILQLTGRKP